MKELGEYLRLSRVNNGVSQEEVAEDLNLSISQIDNIEKANIRAFKDIYMLKDMINQYAKYLGLNLNEIADEFNEFLFEHTSKISVDDILEAKRKSEEKKISKKHSPYTKVYKKKVNYMPILSIILIFVVIFFVVYLILTNLGNTPIRTEELKGGMVCEFTN